VPRIFNTFNAVFFLPKFSPFPYSKSTRFAIINFALRCPLIMLFFESFNYFGILDFKEAEM